MFYGRVETPRQIWDAMLQVKRCRRDWQTNIYLTGEVLQTWIGRGELSMLWLPDSLFLLRQRDGFQRLYWLTADVRAFGGALEILLSSTAGRTMSTDAIYRKEAGSPLARIFVLKGFIQRARLYRMRRDGENRPAASVRDGVAYACEAEASEIEALLRETFDALSDQLPDLDEIVSAVRAKEIFCTRDEDGRIAALAWMTQRGGAVQWRFWLTRPDCRNASFFGRRVRRQAFAFHAGAKYMYLWVHEDNAKAKRLHEETGFVADGLVEDVYCCSR